MVKSAQATINAQMLVWARKTAGYSTADLAQKLAVSETKLLGWEGGTEQMTVKQLRTFADACKRPFPAFYLPAPPHEPPVINDFRRAPHSDVSHSPRLIFEIRKARNRREVALDLVEDSGIEIDKTEFVSASAKENVETIAERVRLFIRVSLKEQRECAEGYDSLNLWRAAFERKGILVFQASGIEVKAMRGFSIAEFPMPVIVLNSKDSPNGKIFTMFHELAHLALRTEGVCDLNQGTSSTDLEVVCNAIAGAALVPAPELQNQPELKKPIDVRSVDSLAKRYRVSSEVVLRRLLTLSKITQTQYSQITAIFQSRYAGKNANPSTGGPPHHIKMLSYAGPLFSRIVLSNYHESKISPTDVSNYLSIKMQSLSDYESALEGKP